MQEFVSDFIGLPLLTRGGEKIGYIKNVQTDKNLTRVRNLECCDEEEEEFTLPYSAIANFGKGAAVVKSAAAKGCKNCQPAPMGMAVFSKEGDLLGSVRDFGREGANITALVLSDGKEISAERIVSVTDTAIVDLSDDYTPRPVVRTRRKPAAKAAKQGETDERIAEKEPTAEQEDAQGETEIVTVRAAASPAEDAAREIAAEENTATETAAPQTKRAGSGLLTGKILPRDLLDARGNLIAREGAKVTADVIRSAMRHDKLFELTLLCCNAPFGVWRR